MKVIVKENLGAEYASDLISSCNQSGIQAIADYTGNEILFYDPKNWLYGRHSDMMKDASLEDDIFSIFNGKTPELRAKVLRPAKGDDFREFAVEWNNLQKQESPDIIKTKQCDMIRFGAHESGMSRSSMKGEFTVKIEWTNDFPKFGISAGDSDEVRVRFSEIDALAYAHGGNGLDELIEETMNEKYPGIGQLDYEDDYIITNLEEMCDYHDMYIGKDMYNEGDSKDMKEDDYDSPTDDEEYEEPEEYEDDPNDWSASEDEVEVQWMIDDEELGIVSGEIETVVIDLGLVDCFEELVYQVELALEKAHGGMRFDYYEEWTLVDADNLLRRFGYSMNESASNGGTMDLTLTFTHGHYGKELKSGDKRTIKVDPSTAPELYDEDDFMAWIADVASDQVPGRGCFTKYDFEIPDEEAYKIIKAVNGDEGFGPDVEIDFEDFEPEDVPSEISYKDALKFYKKMHDAYDDRTLDYDKYDKIRKRLMNATVKGLLREKSLDKLADEWFINYGTMNGWGWKTSFKYNVACALHEIHKKKHPDEHVPDRVDTVRGWHEDNCSCGLRSSCDSSD